MGGQGQKERPVGEIGAGDDILDAVENDRAGSVEQHLVLVGVELADREAAAARQPAKRVGEPRRQGGQIVKCQHMAVVGGDEEIALFARQGPHRGGIGIDQRPQHLREHGLGRALLARDHQQRIGTAVTQRRQQPSRDKDEIVPASAD